MSVHKSRINKVSFELTGDGEARSDSNVTVGVQELYVDDKPCPKGVCDDHMGTTDPSITCSTCFNSKRRCPGHEGSINLKYPVWNPASIATARRWLKLICLEPGCGKPIIKSEVYMKFPAKKRLEEAHKLTKQSQSKDEDVLCVHCHKPHPTLSKDKKEPLIIKYVRKSHGKEIESGNLYPHNIEAIFNRISYATVSELGKPFKMHPKKFILRSIKVPPVNVRPDVKKIASGRSTNDDLTVSLLLILKANNEFIGDLPDVIDKKTEKSICELNNLYFEFVKASGEGSVESLCKRMKGKQGLIRKNQLGKRVHVICRSTIVGDSRLRIDELGIPVEFARTIQIEETLQEYNKKYLLPFIQNGRERYPGATGLQKQHTDTFCSIEHALDRMENGDIIMRDVVDGDICYFNRQPSLMSSNITALRVKIMHDVDIKVFMFNPSICKYFNADFDGDAMNAIFVSSAASRNEIATLASADRWFISHARAVPAFGPAEDAIAGLAQMTRADTKIDKFHAMSLFGNSNYTPTFEDRNYTGREIVSKLLEETPINFSRASGWYDANYAKWIKYDPSEMKVNIVNGKMLSGVLDSKSTGGGSANNLFHTIAHEYGNNQTLSTMFNMQQVAIAFIKSYGLTVTITDLLLPREIKNEIDQIASDIINKSNLITARLNAGEIIPPIGKTVEEFYEELQLNILSIQDDFTDPIIRGINPNANNMFKMIQYGSKGKMSDMTSMVSTIGQRTINNERARERFGYKRTLAYFPRFDTSPEARGYIANSWITGITTSEFVFAAQASRFDLISKALMTSVTGEQNRKSIKNLESAIINNLRMLVKGENIVSYAYGDNYVDTRRLVKVKIPTIFCSDADLKSKYAHDKYPKQFEKVIADRKKYRDIYFKLERMSVNDMISDERLVAVDIDHIIDDVVTRHEQSLSEPNEKVLDMMVEFVDLACDTIAYVLINDIQEAARAPIPLHIKRASWLIRMLMRIHLGPKMLVQHKLTMHLLKIVIDNIRIRYMQALIAPGSAVGIIAAQSFSEPLTQYMLDAHRRSAAGGTSKDSMRTVKELLGAKAVGDLHNPTMFIPLLPQYENDEQLVKVIANNLEMMKLKQFISSRIIFCEKPGEPVHPKFREDVKFINEFKTSNPLIIWPSDLVLWCCRLTINKTTLIFKSMPLETIITKLQLVYPNMFVVYTPENASEIVIRLYFRGADFKGEVTTNEMISKTDGILNTTIRGVEGITNATWMKPLRNTVSADGSIVRKTDAWVIITRGTNLRKVLINKYVDRNRVHTSAIQEMAAMFGIEAARHKIISGIRSIVPDLAMALYLTYVDEMTFTGNVTSIESKGLSARENSNVLLRAGFSSPLPVLEEAALNCAVDTVSGITAPLMVGSIPRIGTLYNRFFINEEFVRENVKKPEDVLAML